MNTLKTDLEAIRSALRCEINGQSRPYLGNLKILDFPDEILLGIFELVECSDHPHLGYRPVRVGVNEPSLAPLKEISRHPTIGKGVRTVRLNLHLYNYSFTDFDWFLSYHTAEVKKQVDLWNRAKLWKLWSTTMHEQPAAEMIANGRAVISTLRRLASADSDDVEYSEAEKYGRARLDGMRLPGNGKPMPDNVGSRVIVAVGADVKWNWERGVPIHEPALPTRHPWKG
ncbi:hypothetical protein N657DRAFT_631104 [Parathielavia appendiculata]|uniref:Uncharacterized protein n=1 Tax=Parathielavia appendiculata TaxID=2587402 RepID=A0AAN6U695_9PEZI|nr:hypothetical protein N657DRAFT_631104 [Parathielavia appendiculata]